MVVIDLSQEIFKGQPVYPGHQPTVVFPMTQIKEFAKEKWSFAVNTILMSEHAGTHTDAFIHNDPGPKALSIESIALEKCMGPAICIDVCEVPDSSFITFEILEEACRKDRLAVPQGGIVLLYTGTYGRHFPKPEYNLKNPGLDRAATEWLVDHGAVNIGIDALSIDVTPHKGEEWKPAHTVCREKRVLNTENLADLSRVAGKSFFYVGLPLKIRGGTAGPMRAVAIMDPIKF